MGAKSCDTSSKGKPHGSGHWLAQRVTALMLIPLFVWFIYALIHLIGASHAEFVAWLSQPVQAVIFSLFIIVSFYHAVIGAQVVVEDYVSNICFRKLKIVGQKLFYLIAGLACLCSIYQIAFAG